MRKRHLRNEQRYGWSRYQNQGLGLGLRSFRSGSNHWVTLMYAYVYLSSTDVHWPRTVHSGRCDSWLGHRSVWLESPMSAVLRMPLRPTLPLLPRTPDLSTCHIIYLCFYLLLTSYKKCTQHTVHTHVTSAPSLLTFRKRLKLHLFRLSYPGLVL